MATLRGRGCFQKSWVGVCGPLPKTLTLFMTKICVSLLPYLWPVQKFDSLFTTVAADTVAPNISYEGLLLLVINKDENVASKKHTQFKTRVLKPYPICNQNGQNQYPIYDQNGWKTLPFGAAHTYLAHIREYPSWPSLFKGHLSTMTTCGPGRESIPFTLMLTSLQWPCVHTSNGHQSASQMTQIISP